MLKTPVVIIIFNRPKLAEKQYEILRQVKPQKVFLISDAAREDVWGEAEKVARSREVFAHPDWECEVQRDFAKENLGCDARIKSGLDWVFSQVAEAIILEDDCIPDPSFFPFCETLLERYKHDERIGYLAGSNQVHNVAVRTSYDFLFGAWTWGWATWARAWNEQVDIAADYEAAFEGLRVQKGLSRADRENRVKTLDLYRRMDAMLPWDYQFTNSCILQNQLSIVPKSNLISNGGFGEDATHTGNALPGYDGTTVEMAFPLQHPTKIEPNRKLQEKQFRFLVPSLWERVTDLGRWAKKGKELYGKEKN